MNQFKWVLFRRCKHISLILLIQVSVLAASAQVKISGKVTGANGTGIPSVSVQIRSTTTGGVTNATGDYEINSNLKPGKYELEFSGVGFKTMTQSFTVGSQTTFTINSQLTEDAEERSRNRGNGSHRKHLRPGSLVST